MIKYVYELKSDMAEEVCLFQQAIELQKSKYRSNKDETIGVELLQLETVNANLIPIGSLQFVQAQLQRLGYQMYPIEVPKVLQTEEFLGREYKIVDYVDLPKEGNWFFKNVSKLKDFAGVVDAALLELYIQEGDFLPSNKTDKWLYSTPLDFRAEYRFYVLFDEIVSYALYDFVPNCFDYFPDIKKVNKMIRCYSLMERPMAYTIDVGVTQAKETFIFEIHPFVSVGIYNTTIDYSDLLTMFNKGYEWYKSAANKPII